MSRVRSQRTTPAARGSVRDGLRRAVIDDQDGPLPAILIALTVLAGVVDATSILALGGVFVATVTGNIVFVGLAIAGARHFVVSTCVLAIGGFVVGALIGGRACRSGPPHRGRATRNVLHVKLALASVNTVIVLAAGAHISRNASDAVVVLLAMSMGAQLALIRYVKVPDMPTVAVSLTIIGALTERGLGWFHPVVLRRALAVLAFAAGATAGGALVLNVSFVASLALGLAIIVGVTIAAHLMSSSTAPWAQPR